MELIDCHSHTALSGHGQGTIADAVARAEELGLATYAQTEHLVLPRHMDPHYEDSMADHVMDDYIAEIKRQREMLAQRGSGMELICGIEADWLDGRADELKELCAPFEYVIGSLHYLDERPVDNSDNKAVWDELGVDGVWKRYFEKWLDMAASDAPISTFGHPDLPKLFGDRPGFDAREYYDAMAQAAAKKGCMVEVNTAGWRKAVDEAYPSLDLLRFFYEAGVECTVGCDAHRPADIGKDVERAYELMRQAGYSYVAAPTAAGDRRYIKLED